MTDTIKVGISHGDINGISYEVIMKTLLDPRIMEMCIPIIYGSPKVAAYHRKALNMNNLSLNHVRINKANIQSEKFNFPGHTEFLARKFESKDYLMLMVSETMKVGLVTTHLPISEIPNYITKESILSKLKIMAHSLQQDFAITRPRIAVFGLNPHAGDNGLLGNEEIDIIMPAIEQAKKEGIMALGPYPADGFFGSEDYRKFDAILAMYHDQGLVPFKLSSFERGVNYTAGLPVIRTSPAHGTAYSLAGEDKASPDSFRQALFLAIDIYKNRQIHEEITKNPLKKYDINSNQEDEGVDIEASDDQNF
jgi:4-hydroxy-L-threonine phosphate dehydrogenase PdxA